MYINISSNQIHIIYKNKNFLIESTNIHKILPVELVKIFKTNKFDKIFLVNGPGSFTNLRSGCLSLNLLSIFSSSLLENYSISKIELYSYFYKSWFLPRYWLIYIWQKKKVWLYDFANNQYEYLEITKIQDVNVDYFVDSIYWDFANSFPTDNIVHIDFDEKDLYIKYLWNNFKFNIQKIFSNKVNNFVPNYMIEPNIYN